MLRKLSMTMGVMALICAVEVKGEAAEPVFAFIALNSARVMPPADVRRALVSILPQGDAITDFEVDEKSVSFTIGRYRSIAVVAQYPIPWDDLEGPCATSWTWKEATARMKAHRAHFVVILQGDGPRTERCLLLAKIMAALATVHDTAGIYWGDGTVVHEPRFFSELAREADKDNLPVLLWLEFRIQKNDDMTTNVLTTGLKAFNLMEVEVVSSRRKPSEVLDIVVSAASMLLAGETFNDGDTIGPDATTKIKTRHAPSIWERKGQVLRIEM